jgi:hypothetical protein
MRMMREQIDAAIFSTEEAAYRWLGVDPAPGDFTE